jgi:Na+/proline symporter
METVLTVLFPDLTLFGQASFAVLGMEFSAALVVVAVLVLIVAVYSLLSGLWGVTITDAFQFVIAIVGSILLAVYALRQPEVGGIAGLKEQLPDATFNLLPVIGTSAEQAGVLALSVLAFVAYIGVQWWSSWYPGAEPGGGGYVAQRMMSAKDERNSLFATLWFTIAHYCLRPWPWILVALASLVLYPDLTDTREGFVMAMRDVLPTGILGMLFAAFLAAFMSTISTQLNWGTSYLVNDFWRRFVKTDGDERYYVGISRLFTFLLALLSIGVTANLQSISQAWSLVLTASAGLGLVLILRWYWWRLNAWSELAATLAPILLAVLALLGAPMPGLLAPFPTNLFAVVGVTTVVWVVATFVTRPTDQATLDAFFRKTRPGGPGWRPIAARHPDVEPDSGLGRLALDWLAGVVLVYSTLFGTGYLLLGDPLKGTGCVLLALGAAAFLWWDLSRAERTAVFEPETSPQASDAP